MAMLQVHHYMNDENIRCKKFLSGSSFEKVVREYQMRLVQDHLQFLHKECRMMVQKELREGTHGDGFPSGYYSQSVVDVICYFFAYLPADLFSEVILHVIL